ncbi:MAG: SMC-Scp complex subunit ScpB [Proteobacteria bacterium]|nr:SMC-Scp complex subunit ScpB [Pseudomonadota bacterium]
MLFTAVEPLSAEKLQLLLEGVPAESNFTLPDEESQRGAERERPCSSPASAGAAEQALTLKEIRTAIELLREHYQNRGVELVEVASGYRFQARLELKNWLLKMHARKTARYSRSFLETLALIAYRQPITRGEIEEVRGVAVSTQIIKSLLDLEWIKMVGQRDVPGKPALYATTKKFLDDFNLQNLNQLPTLKEPQNIDLLSEELVSV